MQNIAPPDYERYAVLTNLFQKYGIESVAGKPPERVTEPAGAVNTDVAQRRGTAARNMTDGNVAPRTKIAKALTGGYLEYRLNGPDQAGLIWLGEASNGIRDTAGNGSVRSAKEVAAIYERTDTILK
jgi:hypothetical protein